MLNPEEVTSVLREMIPCRNLSKGQGYREYFQAASKADYREKQTARTSLVALKIRKVLLKALFA